MPEIPIKPKGKIPKVEKAPPKSLTQSPVMRLCPNKRCNAKIKAGLDECPHCGTKLK